MHVTIKGTCIYTCLPLRSFKKSREKSRKKKREVTAWREKKERKRKKFWSLILALKNLVLFEITTSSRRSTT